MKTIETHRTLTNIKKMKTIETHRKAQLLENYRNAVGCTYREWIKLESESDPNFFRWLFHDESIESIDDLSSDQREAWEDFLNGAEGLTLGDYAEYFDVDTEDESFLFPFRKAGDYYWLTGAELEALWNRRAIRVEYADVTDADRWDSRGGDNVDMEADFYWVKTGAGEFIGLF